MAEHCKHCNELITRNFCDNCGQKKYKRIDKKYIWDELQYTFLHMNKGFLYSVKNILINPGKTAKAYIDGNRVNHYKPILLTFVLSGIAAFISYKFLGLNEIMSQYYAKNNMNSKFMNVYLSLISSYSAFFMVLLIPIFALTTKIAFKKMGHNYFEHIIMNAYILSYYTIVTTVLTYPVMYIYRHDSPEIFLSITGYAILLVPVILVIFYKGFYPQLSYLKLMLKALVILGLTFIGFILLVVSGVMIGVLYAKFIDPTLLQAVKPK